MYATSRNNRENSHKINKINKIYENYFVSRWFVCELQTLQNLFTSIRSFVLVVFFIVV
jgi:hypothetical protein